MANRNEKSPGNIPGAFYVDSTCIDCDMCRDHSPACFRRDDETGMSIVFRQPSNPEELSQARAALEGCPTGSIGNDGSDS